MISCICSLFLFFFPFDDVVGALLFIDRRKSFTRKQKLGTSKDPIKNTTEKPKTVHNFRKKPSSHGSAINLGLFWITALPIFWHWPCSALTICMEANNWRAKTCITLPLLVFSPAAGRTQGSRILRQKKNGEPVNFHIQRSLRHFQGTHVDKKIFLSRYVKNGICLNRVCLEGPPLLFLPKVPTNT